MSLEANRSKPTFFGPAMTLAQALLPSQARTSMVKSCQRHLPSMSCNEAADADPVPESATRINRDRASPSLPTTASPERCHETNRPWCFRFPAWMEVAHPPGALAVTDEAVRPRLAGGRGQRGRSWRQMLALLMTARL